ncbi:malonyl-CoA decarboxylase, mitochondrial-like [Daphnia carinata]|uniref:malonyl-CoA decarboxylase, mitochondrial-like n=1 Tax=Daphnia carinata TaxID=120202 RepID=UPI00257C2E84|nr:malonyl-CoA decarboxylase, mitochondrial-like [Daphnia carinata]
MNSKIQVVIAAKTLQRNIWFQGRPKKAALNQEGTAMSRIALIYPKLAIFRSRTQLTSSATNTRSRDLMKNPLNSHLSVVLMSLNNMQVAAVAAFSTYSPCNPQIQTASILIQKDLFELASKALMELQESKNSSSLVVEKKAHVFCDLYRTLQHSEKKLILNQFALIWSGKQNATMNSVKKYLTAQEKGDEALIKAEDNLRSTLAVDQNWLLSNLARQEGGIKFLIDIRADILEQVEIADATNVVVLRSMSNAIRDLIAPCFGIDMLQLDRVTWSSPGSLLQHVSEGEAVHPVRSWSDLKKRLGPYRRCFILLHPALPKRPLAILHVALTNEISDNIHSIITRNVSHSVDSETDTSTLADDEDVNRVNTAIFYSISSTQKGLAGIDLGQSLIKRALRALQSEIPSLQQHSTLSPIPGFRSWLLQQLRETERGRKTVLTDFDWGSAQQLINSTKENPLGLLRNLLVDSSWMREEAKAALLKHPLMRLCANYLFVEKRRGFALDSVANFHLRNGAIMWRLNWAADLSPRGLKNSFGLMMNYRYYVESCEKNSQLYAEKQHIESSEQIRLLSGVSSQSTNQLSHL